MGNLIGTLPRIEVLMSKKRRGEELTDLEQRQLTGHMALLKVKKKNFNKGAFVKFELDRGTLTGTVVNSDPLGNYLIEFATDSHAVIKASTVVNSYLLRESTLMELEEYVIGNPPYARIVDTNGIIIKFYNNDLEAKRIKYEFVELPESERLYPGSDWGMLAS